MAGCPSLTILRSLSLKLSTTKATRTLAPRRLSISAFSPPRTPSLALPGLWYLPFPPFINSFFACFYSIRTIVAYRARCDVLSNVYFLHLLTIISSCVFASLQKTVPGHLVELLLKRSSVFAYRQSVIYPF